MPYLTRILSIPEHYRLFQRGNRIQKRIMQEYIENDIAAIQKINDGSLTEKDFKKIRSYYGYAVPAVAGEGFCRLRDKPMNKKERLALTYLGAFTGVGDDMFDVKRTPVDHIKELILNPDEKLAQSSNELFFIRLYQKALDRIEDIPSLKQSFLEVIDAQTLSLKQESPDISAEDIEKITIHKGGVSILFYRHAFPHKPDEAERNMLYKLGGIGQLENDLFDVYDDLQDGIHTLVTRETKIEKLRSYYYNLMNEIVQGVYQTHYPDRGKKKFLEYSMLIMARGLVCLDYLGKASNQTHGEFSPGQYQRKDLVCDMGKYSNILKNIHYFAKTPLNKKS